MSDKDLLGKYQSNSPTPSGDNVQNIPTLVKSKKAYKPFSQSNKPEQIKFYDNQGGFDFCNASHVIGGSFRKRILTIITSTQIYILTGKNLKQLAELIADKKVNALYEFNPDTHEIPTDENAVIIEKIELSE
jgi:hypothetical protein